MTRHLLIAGATALALSLAACGPKTEAQGPAASLVDTNPAASLAMPSSDRAPAAPS